MRTHEAPPRGARRRVIAALTVAAMALFTVAAWQGAATAAPTQTAPQKTAEANYTPAACNVAKPGVSKTIYAQCFATVYTTDGKGIVANATTPPPTALGPAQIQAAYGLPASGQGQTVAIVDAFGASTAEADLGTFRSQYGLSPCTTANGCFKKVDQNGGTNYPSDDPGWGLETALDLDAVSSACPACNILLVEGNDNSLDNLGIAVDTAVSLGAKFVSNSYGVPGEGSDETTYDHYYTHPGVAVTASTGDAGDVTNWPATNPNVVAIGGTHLTTDSSPRGWHESAWVDGGSGCSPYEAKPDYQANIATNCSNRAIADISADADPATGLAVYDTLGQSGWIQVGGTSLSSPLVAAMYALAGTPVPGTFPVTYPYQAPAGTLNDVTEGSNGGCGNVLCNAGTGWDGPTGLGTPHGVTALTTGPHGDIAGTVTNGATGAAISGATVSTPDGYAATTDSAGHYDLAVPIGSYDVTASAFAYQSSTTTGVSVTTSATTTVNFGLVAVPSQNLSGTVTDGSGHGWPLYAKITVDGYPGGAVYTDPFTGHYSVDLPQGFVANLHVAPVTTGYTTATAQVTIGTADVVHDVSVPVDETSCFAPGYAFQYTGTGATFSGWTGTTTQGGWSQVDNKGNGQIWNFDNPGNRAVPPGGDADFAILDSDHYGIGNSQDAVLASPVADLTNVTDPTIQFDTYYDGFSNSTGDVDLSLDSGATWTNVWHQTTTSVRAHVNIPIPQAAGSATAQVRFHYTGSWAWWWEIDNVIVGTRTCAPVSGGLVAGFVTDNNTGQALNGAKVAVDGTGDFGVSAATPADPGLADGFYTFFTTASGSQAVTASDSRYVSAHATFGIQKNFVTQHNFKLKAGHLTITPNNVSVSETLGTAKTKTVNVKNDGTEPTHVKLGEQSGSFTPMVPGTGAPVTLLNGHFTPTARADAGAAAAASPTGNASPYAPPWTSIADYPLSIMDNAVAYNDGKVYSVGGYTGSAVVANGYVYDPAGAAWTAIANLPEPLQAARAAFVNGKMYVIGGWNSSGSASAKVYAYDPGANSWSTAASMPTAASAPAVAVLNGSIYAVGGCTTGNCTPTSNHVYQYDPGSDSWTALANYPSLAAFAGCAGIAGEVVCAGGINADTGAGLKSTYIYAPASNSWSQGADMPVDAWAAVTTGANDKLQVAGGAINNGASLTNQVFEYDPAANSWAALANSNNTEYRGGGSCGVYKVGGSIGQFSAAKFAEVLPGYDQCGSAADVPWLSANTTEFDVAAGATVTVTVTMDSSVVPQPGAYTAKLAVSSDSPYSYAPIGVTMNVNPPNAWGKITGTVTDAATGSPLGGVTVQIDTFGGTGVVQYTLKTDASGHYQLWLDARYNPLQVIVAKDGYVPVVKTVKISKGGSTTADFALKKP